MDYLRSQAASPSTATLSGGVTSVNLTSGCVRSGNIASGQVGINHYAAGSIRSGALGSGQLGLNHASSGFVIGQLNANGSAGWRREVLDATADNSGALVDPVPGTGLYRVSVYVAITQGGLLNAGNLSVALGWTDDLQAQTLSPLTGLALLTSGGMGQSVSTHRMLSGTKVFTTSVLSSLTGTPHYNLHAAAERIA